MGTALTLCQDEFNVISLNFAGLLGHCTTADQQQQLRDLKDAALGNLTDAQNKIFQDNDAELDQLIAQGEGVMQDVNAAIAHIEAIATTLNKISQAISVAAEVVSLGVRA